MTSKNKKILGGIALASIILISLFSTNQFNLFQGRTSLSGNTSNTSNNEECLNETVADYALETIKYLENQGESEYNYTEAKIKRHALVLLFGLNDFEYDLQDILNGSTQFAINEINKTLEEASCDTRSNNSIEIEDVDFPDSIVRSQFIKNMTGTEETEVTEVKFTLTLNQDLTETLVYNFPSQNVNLNFYKKESNKFDPETFSFTARGYYDEEDNSYEEDKDLNERSGDTFIFSFNGYSQPNSYDDFNYIPLGDYYVVPAIYGVEFDAHEFEIKGYEIEDFCDLINDDLNLEGYTDKGILDILIETTIETQNLDPQETSDRHQTTRRRINSIMPYENYWTISEAIRMNHTLQCDWDPSVLEQIESDSIEITEQTEYKLEFKQDQKTDLQAAIYPIDGTSSSSYYLPNEKKQIFMFKQYSNSFNPWQEGEYAIKLYNNESKTYTIFDNTDQSQDFEISNPLSFYPAHEELTIQFQTKDEEDFEDTIQIMVNDRYARQNTLHNTEAEMTNNQAEFTVTFASPGYYDIYLESDDETQAGRLGFYVLEREAFIAASKIMPIEFTPEETDQVTCDVITAENEVETFADGPMVIELPCYEEVDKLALTLYNSTTQQPVKTIYYCDSSETCSKVDTYLWDGLINDLPAPNGEYYLEGVFIQNGEKISKQSPQFTIFNLANFHNSASFWDVAPNHPYAQAINWMSTQGFIKGYQDGSFGLMKPVTRAELVKMVAEATRQTAPQMLQRYFNDVNQQDWFFNYVNNASSRGWVQGYPDGSFGPNQEVTRAEAVKIAMVAHNIQPSMIQNGSPYIDIPITEWFYVYLQPALEQGLLGTQHVVGGINQTLQYFPNQSMTRGEVAEMLFRMNQLQNQGNTVDSSIPEYVILN